MSKNRTLWCDKDADAIKLRFYKLHAGFARHAEKVDDTGSDISYKTECEGIELGLRITSDIFRKTSDGTIVGDIARYILRIDSDMFMFVVPREWISPSTGNARVLKLTHPAQPDLSLACSSPEKLFNEVVAFLEDYL